jgi:hypothetical protein
VILVRWASDQRPKAPRQASGEMTRAPRVLWLPKMSTISHATPPKMAADGIALGFSAPVAMDVAIALAVSWKPFVKSNATPATTTRIRTRLDPMPGAQ